MSNIATPPSPIFCDVDGSPLKEGFLFIGETNKEPSSFPTPVYWDENLTIEATQPIAIKNGLIRNNNLASKIYIGVDSCSIELTNKNNTSVFKLLNYLQIASQSKAQEYVAAEENRALAAESALQQSISDETVRATGIEASLQSQINVLGVGNKAYLTYAAMDADKANIPANSKVTVTNDSTSSNNGDWQWNGTTFTKSTFDPLTQAKTYTDDSLRTLESNRPQNPNKFTLKQVNFTIAPTSLSGTATYPFRNGIKQLKLVSAFTGNSIVVYWDFPVSQFTREFSASVCVEGLTSGSNGLVGIQQVNDANTVLSSTYAATGVSAAVTKQTYKVNVSGVSAGATKIRLIVNMQTTTTREMYVHSPFIADGINAEFISPPDTTKIDTIYGAFNVTAAKNKFNPALAVDGQVISFQTGNSSANPDYAAFGKQAVEAGKTYTFWIPTSSPFTFYPVIYTYSSTGTFLGLDHSIPSAGEVVNPNPPTGIVYADGSRTVTFTIPSGSSIAFIQMRSNLLAHTNQTFVSTVNGMQMEEGSVKTSFESYEESGIKVIIKSTSLPDSSGQDSNNSIENTFTVSTDGTDAYVRTSFNSTFDLVQQIRYGANTTWSNNSINPRSVRTIPKITAKDSTISAFALGSVLIEQGDDAAPLHYNGTYIGANHGAFIVREVTATAHGKTFVDVGSQWSQGANTWTIVRIVDANKLWLVSQNVGTTYWQFITSSLSGLTLTHSTGATNTASFTPSSDIQTQLMAAVNNHTKRIVIDGFRDVTSVNGVYDAQSVEFIDNYDVMNVPAIISYLQAHVGTAIEQPLSNNSIASDIRVSVNYRYAFNGSCVINTQLQSKSALNLSFAGFTQAMVANYTGKTLLQYVNKVNPIVGPSKTWNFANVEDITTTIDEIHFLKANWSSSVNPPDRMAQIVKNGATKEFGHVIGYSLTRGISKPAIRQNTSSGGFVYTSRKMYPWALTANVYAVQPNGLMPSGTVVNHVAYRFVFNAMVLPQATVYGWYEDNKEIYVVLDIHQNASMLTLPLPDVFNGKSATVIDSNANFTLHSEIVSDGGLLCSIINSYGQATIKLT